jgi:threonine dehydrogenase-like Zn-dependent dehydrogenase
LRSGNVDVEDLITHRYRLEEISRGFKAAGEGKNCLKVIIKPHG